MTDKTTSNSVDSEEAANSATVPRNDTGSESDDPVGYDAMSNYSNQENTVDKVHHEASELLRTVTNYTPYAVMTGQAAREEDEEIEQEEEASSGLKRVATTRDLRKQFGFWDARNAATRKQFFKQYPAIVLLLCMYLLGAFSVFWGSMYKRETRLGNLKVLVALEDDSDAVISQALKATFQNSTIKDSLGWEFTNYTEPATIKQRVFEQKYWGAFYVSASNISTELTAAFENGNEYNTTGLINCYYETGRDFSGISNYVKPTLMAAYPILETIMQTEVYPDIISNLSKDQFAAMKNTTVLTKPPSITYTDGKPATNPVLVAPLQIGLIFIIILSFFQVLWFVQLNGFIAQKLVPTSYIGYRICSSQICYFFMALAYACLNRAFQINLEDTWKGGFVILWFTSYLLFAAVGGANDNVALICLATLPPLMGFWVLFFVIISISATFFPIELCPKVFRYNHAMPLKNAYEIMKVIYLDTWRGHLGRNYGILVAWVAVNTALLPLCVIFFSYRAKKKIQAAEKARIDKEKTQ